MSLHGPIFKELDLFWNNLRKFAFENKTIFEIFFIFLYSFEQILLIMVSYKAKNVQELSLAISVFAVIVLATFSFHKLLMESRIKYLENQVAEINGDKRMLEEENKTLEASHAQLLSEVEELISFDMAKNLNLKRFYLKNEKGGKNENK